VSYRRPERPIRGLSFDHSCDDPRLYAGSAFIYSKFAMGFRPIRRSK